MTVCSLVFFWFEQEPVELVGMYGDGSAAGTEAKSEHAKVCIKEREEHS